MSKINGLVELESSYITAKAELKILRIELKREEMKRQYIQEYKDKYYAPPKVWQFWKSKTAKVLTDEEFWVKLNKEYAEANFLSYTPRHWVENSGRDTEADMKLLISASKGVPAMLVSAELAAILSNTK